MRKLGLNMLGRLPKGAGIIPSAKTGDTQKVTFTVETPIYPTSA